MNDKQYKMLALVIGIAVVAYWAMQKNGKPVSVAAAPAQSTLPIAWNSPMASAYNADPTAFAPITPGQLDVTINNQSGNLLSNQYVPLFGFVGMAQGSLYQ